MGMRLQKKSPVYPLFEKPCISGRILDWTINSGESRIHTSSWMRHWIRGIVFIVYGQNGVLSSTDAQRNRDQSSRICEKANEAQGSFERVLVYVIQTLNIYGKKQ